MLAKEIREAISILESLNAELQEYYRIPRISKEFTKAIKLLESYLSKLPNGEE